MLIVRRTIQSSLFKEFVNATFENVQSITQFVQTIGQIATQSLKTKLLRQIKNNNTMPKKKQQGPNVQKQKGGQSAKASFIVQRNKMVRGAQEESWPKQLPHDQTHAPFVGGGPPPRRPSPKEIVEQATVEAEEEEEEPTETASQKRPEDADSILWALWLLRLLLVWKRRRMGVASQGTLSASSSPATTGMKVGPAKRVRWRCCCGSSTVSGFVVVVAGPMVSRLPLPAGEAKSLSWRRQQRGVVEATEGAAVVAAVVVETP